MRRATAGTVTALATGLVLALPATGAAVTISDTTLALTPAVVGPHTAVRARFRQPVQGGMLPSQLIVERVAVTGPDGDRCASGMSTDVPTALGEPTAPGEPTVTLTLRPASGAAWCAGVHVVTLTVTQTDTCSGIVPRVCPQQTAFTRTVASARFRVRD